ncbi:lim and transglutaminase domain protein ltd-1-like [Argopecten irradians]|uniref:lim and transglutaminase domain protein ltd-1-like n=1 Tax=Argopecten irradians TaxID=31199 RepID=UPI00371ACE18
MGCGVSKNGMGNGANKPGPLPEGEKKEDEEEEENSEEGLDIPNGLGIAPGQEVMKKRFRNVINMTRIAGRMLKEQEERAIEKGRQNTSLKEPEREEIVIPDTMYMYPPARPPRRKKKEIFHESDCILADAIAMQVDAESVGSIDELVRALTVKLKTDMQKLRALFMWLGVQRIRHRTYPTTVDPATPLGHLKRMAMGRVSYAVMFTLLCRSAKLPCVIIRGLAKSASYEVGDKNLDNLRNMWNAVYVSGEWRFVFPLWALSSVVGKTTGDWTLMESKGDLSHEKQEESVGENVNQVDDYYFLIDPEEFCYTCFPDEERWQLLREPISKRKFIRVPYLWPPYFQHGLQISTKFDSIIKTKKGKCNIAIKPGPEYVPLSYELFFNHKESDRELPDDIHLDRYVAIMNEPTKTNFVLRLPVDGIYKLEVVDEDNDWICFFKIWVDEDIEPWEPFPINSAIGFGPCRETEKAGLRVETLPYRNGIINMTKKQQIQLKFTMLRNLQIRTELVHNTIPQSELTKHISHKLLDNQLTIHLTVPQNGEYALQIHTREKDKGPHEEFRNACNYLVETDVKPRKDKGWENAREKLIRQRLDDTTNTSKDPKEIQEALDKFNDLELINHGEVDRAQRRIGYLEVRNDLRDGINGRNMEKLEKALTAGKISEYRDKLETLIQEGETLLNRLKQLKFFAHDVLLMERTTVSEIHRYNIPKQCVHDVMKATFLVLGENENFLEDWEFIQDLLRKTGKESVLKKIKDYDSIDLETETAQRAADLISQYDKANLVDASAAAGAFYVWVYNITKEVLKWTGYYDSGGQQTQTQHELSNGTISQSQNH